MATAIRPIIPTEESARLTRCAAVRYKPADGLSAIGGFFVVDEVSDEPPVLDLRGLKCPLPVLRTRKALLGLSPGQRLAVLCTDPMAAIDIPNLLREQGDRLESRSDFEGTLRFVIERGGRSASFLLPVDV